MHVLKDSRRSDDYYFSSAAFSIVIKQDIDADKNNIHKPYLSFGRRTICRSFHSALLSSIPLGSFSRTNGKCSIARRFTQYELFLKFCILFIGFHKKLNLWNTIWSCSGDSCGNPINFPKICKVVLWFLLLK